MTLHTLVLPVTSHKAKMSFTLCRILPILHNEAVKIYAVSSCLAECPHFHFLYTTDPNIN